MSIKLRKDGKGTFVNVALNVYFESVTVENGTIHFAQCLFERWTFKVYCQIEV